MTVKKFIAATSREALRKVREALGVDAVILSNRSVHGAVEILAMTQDAITSITSPVTEQTDLLKRVATIRPDQVIAPQPDHVKQDSARTATVRAVIPALRAAVAPEAAEAVAKGAAPRFAPPSFTSMSVSKPLPASTAVPVQSAMAPSPVLKTPPRVEQAQASSAAEKAVAPQRAPDVPVAAAPAPVAIGEDAQFIMNEIRSMRGMIESQLTEISWSATQKREPAKAAVLRELLAAGFSAALSRYLTENMPHTTDAKEGLQWAKTILARNLATLSNEDAMIEKGGVYALVGPTGVGKTTTTAKLAARCVMRHGPGKLALITTDAYRIGAYEQLRIYGKILGVMVHAVKDEADLRIALNEMKGKHTVLIDTVGVSQRDQMVAEQVAMLSGADTHIKRLLCLNATSTGETLAEVVNAYKGTGLAGCVMTKVDEAATIGSLLDVVIRQKMDLYYVANGQRVPEDLVVADKQFLVDRAFALRKENAPFELRDAELPLVMAGTTSSLRDRTLREVRLG